MNSTTSSQSSHPEALGADCVQVSKSVICYWWLIFIDFLYEPRGLIVINRRKKERKVTATGCLSSFLPFQIQFCFHGQVYNIAFISILTWMYCPLIYTQQFPFIVHHHPFPPLFSNFLGICILEVLEENASKSAFLLVEGKVEHRRKGIYLLIGVNETNKALSFFLSLLLYCIHCCHSLFCSISTCSSINNEVLYSFSTQKSCYFSSTENYTSIFFLMF